MSNDYNVTKGDRLKEL